MPEVTDSPIVLTSAEVLCPDAVTVPKPPIAVATEPPIEPSSNASLAAF